MAGDPTLRECVFEHVANAALAEIGLGRYTVCADDPQDGTDYLHISIGYGGEIVEIEEAHQPMIDKALELAWAAVNRG